MGEDVAAFLYQPGGDRALSGGTALMERLRRHRLAIALGVQAILLCWNLSLLAPWFDEADTLLFMKGPLAQAIAIPASGLHPPLYFLLLYGWMRVPLGLSWTVQARVLSVLFGLAATAAADRFWARRLGPRGRAAFLALWVASPCLLLYCRMARSYSLQLLLATVAAGLIRDSAERPTRKRTAALAGVLAALLWVHYVPGAAMLAAAVVALGRSGRWRTAATVVGVAVAAFLPWLPKLVWSLEVWGAHRQAYAISGSRLAEIPIKAAYWGISFLMGEALPDWLLATGALVGIVAAACLVKGALRTRRLLWIALPATAVGFVGVMRWVSYPFIPARMLFTLPMFLALVVAGARKWVIGGLLAVSVCGVWCYYHLIGFRNKQYPMPMGEIAAQIRAGSSAADSVVLVDSTNSDPIGLRYALWPDRAVLETGESDTRAKIAAALADPRIRTVWFLRNTHDVSLGLNAQFESELMAAMRAHTWPYENYSPLEQRLMRGLGWTPPPQHFSELLEFRR
jgi:hypothetical protein